MLLRKTVMPMAVILLCASVLLIGTSLPFGGSLKMTAYAAGQLIEISPEKRLGHLHLTIGHSETIKIDIPYSEIVVGDPQTADVSPLTNKSLYVLGRKIGTTNITLFNDKKEVAAVVDIEVTPDLKSLRQVLRENIPKSRIRVRTVNGRTLLTGEVPSATAAKRAVDLAKTYSGELLVSNLLTIAANQQVNLEVRFIEVSRSAGKELGINFNLTKNGGGPLQGTGVVNINAVPSTVLANSITPFGVILANIFANGISPDIVISALEEKNLARRLAEPTLTTMSGKEASFHAGGEVPIPISDGDGDITIEFKEFGIRLTFLPTVLDNGRINLEVRPEVSQIDPTISIQANAAGISVPGFTVRKAKTTVELRDGQSFAIAGLLQTVNQRQVEQLPWLGDLPVLGTLFRSSAFQKQQTDLVIIVTPRLVSPVGTRKKLRTPLEDTYASNEPELFLYGKLEVSKKELDQKYKGLYGHILDLPKGVNHAVYKK